MMERFGHMSIYLAFKLNNIECVRVATLYLELVHAMAIAIGQHSGQRASQTIADLRLMAYTLLAAHYNTCTPQEHGSTRIAGQYSTYSQLRSPAGISSIDSSSKGLSVMIPSTPKSIMRSMSSQLLIVHTCTARLTA